VSKPPKHLGLILYSGDLGATALGVSFSERAYGRQSEVQRSAGRLLGTAKCSRLKCPRLRQVAHARTEAEECTKRAPWFAKGYLRLAAAAARLRHPLAAARACVAGLAALEQQGEQRKGKHTDSDQPEQPASRAPAYPSLSAEGREGGAEARAGGGEDRAGDARPTPDERLRADLQVLRGVWGGVGWGGGAEWVWVCNVFGCVGVTGACT